MKTFLISPLLLFLAALASLADGIVLEQIISRENPSYANPSAIMTVGRDGRVYLYAPEAIGARHNGFLLRVTPDGRHRHSAHTGAAWGSNATANEEGIAVTTNPHFAHSVRFFDADLRRFAAVTDFLNNDGVGWGAPQRVEAGASGDFYALGASQDRVLRMSPAGRVLRAYAIPPDAIGGTRRARDFRVHEESESLYILGVRNEITRLGFDGEVRWTLPIWRNGGWDISDDGTLYFISAINDTVFRADADGQPAGEVTLEGLRGSRIGSLQVWGDEIFIKRQHPTEMFRRYNRADGSLIHSVDIRYQHLTVAFPDRVWTAGQTVPFDIRFDADNETTTPQWRIWARPFNAPYYQELKLDAGQIAVPDDWAGLYVVKVSPETQPLETETATSEYLVRTIVEVRRPDTEGTVNVMTPRNRLYYGQGEKIPVSIILRAPDANLPNHVTLNLHQDARLIATTTASVKPNPDGVAEATVTLPSDLTAALLPGAYSLSADVPGLTPVAQHLVIGRGIPDVEPFFRVQHADYQRVFPIGDHWTTPEVVAMYRHRAEKMKTNLFVDRLGIGGAGNLHHLEWLAPQQAALNNLEQLLGKDPYGIAPGKALIEPSLLQTQAAYSADGRRQMAILLNMDAGLPLGTGHDRRTPEQFQDAITKVTKSLAPYPSFRGWVWTSNWWVWSPGMAIHSPEERAAYTAALEKAKATGAWDPILQEVGRRRFDFATDAQSLFNDMLATLDEEGRYVRASAGPYRRLEAYPPRVFSNVDEVDLQYQAEQIQPPQTTPHNVDYQKRPGKAAWGHPELWNDSGTGDQILPSLLQMVMRGADGIGISEAYVIRRWGVQAEDSRLAYGGATSVGRTLHALMERYGRWLRSLETHDQVAIVVSSRQAHIEEHSGGVGGRYFNHLFEAYQSCLYAQRPATFVFTEDLGIHALTNYQAVLLVGQTVELDPPLKAALDATQAKGIPVFYDGTCREALVQDYTPLGLTFDSVDRDRSAWQDDSAYWRFTQYFLANRPILRDALPSVGSTETDHTQVLVSERRADQGRYHFVVNNTLPLELDPGHLWRKTMAITTRVPVQSQVRLPDLDGKTVYDVFALREVTPRDGAVMADLRTVPMRVFAVLPTPIDSVALLGPASASAGQRIQWEAQIQDPNGDHVAAAIPVRVRVRAADGSVLYDEHLSAPPSGSASGEVTLPLNVVAGPSVIEVTELFSGKSARLAFQVQPAELPVSANHVRAQVPDTNGRGHAVEGVETPAEAHFGPRLRDIAVLDDGALAVINAFNWDNNLYGIDLSTGDVRWRRKFGQHFSYAPQTLVGGFAVQGFDFEAPEGYHLYLSDRAGQPERKFALYGLPKRLPDWAFPALLKDRINNFAVAGDGSWIASSGGLGLVVWNRNGDLLWSQDWRENRREVRLMALGARALLVADGALLQVYDAASGALRGDIRLAESGIILDMIQSADGQTVALRGNMDGGRIFLLRRGEVIAEFPTPSHRIVLAPNGEHVGVLHGEQLKWYAAQAGLQWSYTGDDTLRHAAIADDGRIAIASELGTIAVLDAHGTPLMERDMASLTAPAWLPDGDLLLATWMGQVVRLNAAYEDRWIVRLQPDDGEVLGNLLPVEDVAVTRMTGWSTAAEEVAPLTPNLLKESSAIIQPRLVRGEGRQNLNLQNSAALLIDGNTDAPPNPWLSWTEINKIDSGWRGPFSLIFDTFRTQIRVEGITFIEDPAHPQSWVRDTLLEYWDPARAEWITAQALLADAPAHTHWLNEPVAASRFRLVAPPGRGSWPVGNLRLAEVVFHGELLGSSHPDVIAKKPVAVLFDEGEELREAFRDFSFRLDDAFSGGRSIAVAADKQTRPGWHPPFGHVIRDWDFIIAENPEPGEYRYLQFAWKALSPETTGMTLRVSPSHQGGVSFYAGEATPFPSVRSLAITDTPPQDWRTVRIDLWEAMQTHPLRIRMLYLGARGGEAAFDQIVLGRTEADLPPEK